MEKLLKKYSDKLVAQGLCEEGAPLLGGLDADLEWNRTDPACKVMEAVVDGLNINSILFAKPAEPYFSMLKSLCREIGAPGGAIRPEDSETRTFLHDIPVSGDLAAERIIDALKKRKSVVIPDHGIVTFGTVSPEQAFITYSSVCFSGFVKYCADYLAAAKAGRPDKRKEELIAAAADSYRRRLLEKSRGGSLKKGPLQEKGEVLEAVIRAGKLTVDCRLVDSFFGNASVLWGDTIYISQTGSSLDELAGCIDGCPVDGSSCIGITASSEFTAHRDVYAGTQYKTILHGHPKFSVILSLACDEEECAGKGRCHIECPRERFVADIPVVPGETGTGPHGLCHTLPPAMKGRRGVIVYGHGLFTAGRRDFTDAFANLVDIEIECIEEYFRRLGSNKLTFGEP